MQGSIQKRGENRWRLRVDLGTDAAGKRIQKSLTVHGTRRDAEKKMTELLHEVHQGHVVAGPAMTLEEYLRYWLEHYARRLSERTFENYREYVANYLIPGLGSHRLDQLLPSHVQTFYTKLRRVGGKRKTGLSATTVYNCHRVLKGALRQAVTWQMLGKNPAAAVTPPKPEEREPKVLTIEQVTVLLEAAQGTRLYLPVLLALSTGMRRGELCGLRWQDINWEKGVIAVRQTLVRVATGNLQRKTPKTKTGKRTIKLPSVMLEVLAAHKARLEELRQTLGKSYNSENLVICREDGTVLHPATLYSTFQDLLLRLGLPRMAIHDLRHSHATHLLEQGVNPKVVSERLGHSDPALTLRVYSHVLEHIQQDAADRTDTLIREALKPRTETNPPESSP